MNKIDVNKAIIEALKKEFEYREEDYDQWVMGASIKQDEVAQEFRVKVIVHTSESIYTDGMELEVTVVDGVAKLEEDFFEKTPDLMGSPVKDAIKWLREFKIIHLQLLNPYEYNIYLQRLEEVIKEYSFKTLSDYNLESTNGTNLENLYQDLLQETLLKNVKIEGVKLSLGEYELKVIVDGKSYYLNCRSSDTREIVIEEIKNEIIIPVMEDIEADSNSNNTNYENTKEMI